ncbi:hypothetical protein KKH27_02185 [bacterium]|nr:hypothetical protein [bacterium]
MATLIASAAVAGLRNISPRPQQMGTLPGGPAFLGGTPVLLIPDNPTGEELVVRDEALRLFAERFGRVPEVITWSQRTNLYPMIWMGTFSRLPALAAALDSAGYGGLGTPLHGEEYQLLVQDRRVLLGGSDLRAVRWGLFSLMELMADVMGQLVADRVYIRDWPDFSKRITTVNAMVRTSSQTAEANFLVDCGYRARMNEIEWNDGDAGIRDRRAYSFEQALLLRNKIKNYGMALTMSVDKTAYQVNQPCWQEGIPIRGTLLKVGSAGCTVIPTSFGSNIISNNGYEDWTNNRPNNWTTHSESWYAYVSRDAVVKRSGASSVKFSGFSGTSVTPELRQLIRPGAWRAFKISFWYKTEGYVGKIRAFDQGATIPYNKSTSWYGEFPTPTTTDWTKVEVVFCTFRLDSMYLFIGPYSATQGTVWLDDVSMEAIEPEKVVRRTDTPLEVYSQRTNLLLSEGIDYRVVETGEYSYDRYVSQPRFERLSGGRLVVGDTIRVNWSWAFRYQGVRQTNCFSQIEPLIEYQDRIAVLDSVFRPDGFKIHINEVSYANYDDACTRRNLTPGALVGSYCRQMYQIIQARRPGAPVRIYGDPVDIFVYDPRAMPVSTRSWTPGMIEQLPDPVEVMAMTDYSSNLDSTFTFLSNSNHRSVLAVYLPLDVQNWLTYVQKAARYPMCDGVESYHWGGDTSTISSRIAELGRMAWNSGPYIMHEPLDYSYRPDTLVIRAEAWSDPFSGYLSPTIVSCQLSYRLLPSGNWTQATMTPTATDQYMTQVALVGPNATAFEYYLTVTDSRTMTSKAPADAPGRTFVVALPLESGPAGDLRHEEIPHRTRTTLGNTLLEWEERSGALYYEIHRGPCPEFRENSPTIVARQSTDCPRLMLPVFARREGETDAYQVFAIVTRPDDRPGRRAVMRK